MKIGRNEPCPCGSGKKFKKCCINQINDQQNFDDMPFFDSPAFDENWPTQFWGYVDVNTSKANEYLLEEDKDGMVCMVSNITSMNIEPVSESTGIEFEIDDWFFSVGAHENTTVYGPFENEGIAMEEASKLTGAERFRGGLEAL